MAIVSLKNAGMADPATLEDSKTKAALLASEKERRDLCRDIYDITFYEKSCAAVQVITNSEASSSECSLSAIDVYVVAQKIGGSP